MFNNGANTIVYHGLAKDQDSTLHYFDLFISQSIGQEIVNWLSNNTKHWYFYEAINTTNIVPVDQLFTSENNDDKSFWYWLFIDDDTEAMHFRLTWENCGST